MDIDTYLDSLGLDQIKPEVFWELLERVTSDPILKEWQRLIHMVGMCHDIESEKALDEFCSTHTVPGLGISFAEFATRTWQLDKHRQVSPFVLDWCRTGQNVLEVGCGLGYLCGFLGSNLPDHVIVAIDRLAGAVVSASSSIAKLGLKNIVLLNVSFEYLPERYNHFFDHVVLRDVCGNDFDLMCNQDEYTQRLAHFFARAVRCLSPGGSIWYSLSIGSDLRILRELGWCVEVAAQLAELATESEENYTYLLRENDREYHHSWLLARKE